MQGSLRRLLARATGELFRAHGRDLFGVYAFGAVAYPGFTPYGDIDLLVVLRKGPLGSGLKRDGRMWKRLARGRLGALLDPFYMRASALSRGGSPRELRFGGRDGSWALHRAHFLSGAFIPLFGPDPRPFLRRPSSREVRRELAGEHRFALRQADRYPAYAVMQFARLAMTARTGKVANSKYATGLWARTGLPSRWRPLVAAAAKVYRHCGDRKAEKTLSSSRDEIRAFAAASRAALGGARVHRGA